MLTGNFLQLYERLVPTIDRRRIFHDPLHTLAFGTDASFYRLIPKMVIKARNEAEISLILQEASKLKIAVTFRAAGTSLSGQAISDSVLVIAGSHWKKAVVEENGTSIRLQPGLTGSEANALLAKYGRKIGPDPASIQAAMIGGIAANNASGMCCGIAENSYQTLLSMRIILQDGTMLDTGDETSKDSFRKSHASFLLQIDLLKESVSENTELTKRIHHKYQIKNTTGYSLNALVDFSDPIDIMQHLMIGSEGTLGFISEINYRTVVEHPCKATSLMLFPTIHEACEAVISLQNAPVSAVELIDRAGLKSVENEQGLTVDLKILDDKVCALLVETRSNDIYLLKDQIDQITAIFGNILTVAPVVFTSDPAECARLWKIRKGMFPSIGAMRKKSTTVIIEDVAFPVIRLAEATMDLQQLFEKWGYHEAVIFGHALMGNLHFVFTQDFSSGNEVERYKNLMEEVSDLVVRKYDGALKAEHGTGRNMAPFVEMEWGKDAFQLMQRIKNIFDPDNLLNPGVILNTDPLAHLKFLKPIPAAHEKIDSCIECGFCEPNCVSAELTLTPRQRIVAYREIAQLRKTGKEPHLLGQLLKSYRYAGNETCATDGLCATACPVKIDTGKLIKSIRTEEIGTGQKSGIWVADRMRQVTKLMRTGLNFVAFPHAIFGTKLMTAFTQGARWITFNKLPLWNPWMPTGAKPIQHNPTIPKSDESNSEVVYFPSGARPSYTNPTIQQSDKSKSAVVYFPSCINRTMGPPRYEKDGQLTDVMLKLLHKGGFEVLFPENLDNLCCGMAFSSKGYIEAGDKKSSELEAALLQASENGKYPILCDMSPCLYTMRENMGSRMKLYEPVEFIMEHLLPLLSIQPLSETIAVFPVCSLKKMGLEDKQTELARLCAKEVIVAQTNCCGFAGDRGFSFPELNKHGLSTLKGQLPKTVLRGYSNSRTCEIGLSLHSGIPFQSIVYLVDKVSTAKA